MCRLRSTPNARRCTRSSTRWPRPSPTQASRARAARARTTMLDDLAARLRSVEEGRAGDRVRDRTDRRALGVGARSGREEAHASLPHGRRHGCRLEPRDRAARRRARRAPRRARERPAGLGRRARQGAHLGGRARPRWSPGSTGWRKSRGGGIRRAPAAVGDEVVQLRVAVDGLRMRLASNEQELATVVGTRDTATRLDEVTRRLEALERAPVVIAGGGRRRAGCRRRPLPARAPRARAPNGARGGRRAGEPRSGARPARAARGADRVALPAARVGARGRVIRRRSVAADRSYRFARRTRRSRGCWRCSDPRIGLDQLRCGSSTSSVDGSAPGHRGRGAGSRTSFCRASWPPSARRRVASRDRTRNRNDARRRCGDCAVRCEDRGQRPYRGMDAMRTRQRAAQRVSGDIGFAYVIQFNARVRLPESRTP